MTSLPGVPVRVPAPVIVAGTPKQVATAAWAGTPGSARVNSAAAAITDEPVRPGRSESLRDAREQVSR